MTKLRMADSLTEKPEKPEPGRRLKAALWGHAEDEISHDECRALMPQLVEAEAAGENAAARYARVQRHLDQCEDCGEEYAMLVDLELAEQAGKLELEKEAAPPALAYQQGHTPELQTIIVEWTRALLAILAPTNTGELDRAADTFFAVFQPRRAFETRAAYGQALGIGKAAPNPAFTTLAACFATTRELIAQVSQQDFDRWRAQERLGAELETRAQASARGIGLEPVPAQDLARAFAQVVMQDPVPLRNLLSPN